MKDVIQEALSKGLLDDFGEHDYHLGTMLRGIAFLRQGALLPGICDLNEVPRWRRQEIKLVKELVPSDILLNAFADEYHHSFSHPPGGKYVPQGFMWGVLLGERMTEVYDYYEKVDEFYARVVGTRYDDRPKNIKTLKVGDEVYLLHETVNPYDPNAIRVITTASKDLGYLRRTLAEMLAPRMDEGMHISARVTVILDRNRGGDCDDPWVYLRLKLYDSCRVPRPPGLTALVESGTGR
ncbi:MAG: hypothetical protein HPY52_10900 [Firmicutes bacterium]|nr:hypothetical protein [Bacillota bacterium]